MLANTPTSERIHIAVFGRTNTGKSSIFNAICNQNMSIVSDIEGTTTDAVKKTMELLPLGPVIIYDTAGFDDLTELGKKRFEKTIEILNKTDIAIFVTDNEYLTDSEKQFKNKIAQKNIPFIWAINKQDNTNENEFAGNIVKVSAKNNINIDILKDKLAKLNKKSEKYIISDRLNAGDSVVLVIPIDESAPKGRLILPQQLVLRELLDKKCIVTCLQPDNLCNYLSCVKHKPKIVITDSQAFDKVKDIVDDDIFLTSFSILFANYKGNLKTLVNGAKKLDTLKDDDIILVSEGCTHHRQCNDIGTVKIPKLIKKYTGKELKFEYTQGGEFPEALNKFSLIVHCGGCMLNEKDMHSRIQKALISEIPIVNYGILISHINGILKKSIKIFPEI